MQPNYTKIDCIITFFLTSVSTKLVKKKKKKKGNEIFWVYFCFLMSPYKPMTIATMTSTMMTRSIVM
jgi:hypothetical protein